MSTTKKAAVPIEPETVIYVGPELRGVVKRYTVFNNGLPESLKEYIKDKPVFKALIVPVEKLAQTNAALERDGSALNVIYKKACQK